MKLFICCMTSPRTTMARIADLASYEVLGVKGDVTKLRKSQVIIVLTQKELSDNLEWFNNYKGTVILHCPVLVAQRFQGEDITYLDTITSDEITTNHRFKSFDTNELVVHDFDEDYSQSEIKYDNVPYLPRLIDSVRQGSLLNSLMTLIYQVGSSQLQQAARNFIVFWLIEDGKDFDVLEKELIELGVKEPKAKALVECVETNAELHLKILKTCIKRGEDKKPVITIDSAKIAKAHPNFDLYELRYLVNSYRKLDYGKDIRGKTLHEIYYERPRNAPKRAK